MRTRGRTLVVCVVALATKVLAVVLCVGVPDHTIQGIQRQNLASDGASLLVCQ